MTKEMKNLLAVLEAQKELNWRLSNNESLPLEMRLRDRAESFTQMNVIALITDKEYLKTIADTLHVVLEEEEKEIHTKNMMVAEYDSKKMHIYDVKTTGKHPVHMVEGGLYLTEDETIINQQGEMGWFWLNETDYNYFKSLIKEVAITIKK